MVHFWCLMLFSAFSPSYISKPDMSRLRLAAACALLKLAQEPCYHEIITLEQYQLCSLVINVRSSPSFLTARSFCASSDVLTLVFLVPTPGRVLPGATVFFPEAPPGTVSPPVATRIHGCVRIMCQGPRKGEEGARSPVSGEKC